MDKRLALFGAIGVLAADGVVTTSIAGLGLLTGPAVVDSGRVALFVGGLSAVWFGLAPFVFAVVLLPIARSYRSDRRELAIALAIGVLADVLGHAVLLECAAAIGLFVGTVVNA